MKLNKITLNKLALPNKNIIIDNSGYINLLKKQQILATLENLHCSSQLISFFNEFVGISIMTSIDENLFQHFDIMLPQNPIINFQNLIQIGKVVCCGQKIPVFWDCLENIFLLNKNEKIAHNELELFQFFLSDKSILPIKIFPRTIDCLKKSGWYNGRKCDISELLEQLNCSNMNITKEQKEFIQEYNDLEGKTESGSPFKIHVDSKSQYICNNTVSINTLESMNPLNSIAIKNNISFLLVGEVGYLSIPVWISSDGFLFMDQGNKLGRTITEAWQSILLD